MSYQVLARKWRPRDFEGVVGQEHVVKALRHALREKRLHHAYLFTGTRGVGKTTLSRILAKCLNCTGADGHGDITDKPCGCCDACRSIDEGHFVDYIEMDAASNRGVDEMTALLEQAMYPPTNARFKVYMIDEVHQLSNTAFNAMLKTLEEPPEYVKFILATTDPQKVPITVLSRCLQFNLRNMTPQEVSAHLAHILEIEKIEAEPAALRLLAAGARGSMRDGLSLLDQAIAFSDGRVTLEGVRSMLGVVDSSVLFELLRCLKAGDAAGMLRIADAMGARSFSYAQGLRDLAGLLHRAAIAQRVPESLRGEADAEDVLAMAKLFSPEEIQLYYQIAISGRNDLHLAPDEYAGFTMTLLRMLAFAPAGSRAGAKVPPAGGWAAAQSETPAAAPAPAPAAKAAAPASPEPAPAPKPEPKPAAVPPPPPPPAPEPAPAPAQAAPAAPEPAPFDEELPPWVQSEPAEADIPDDLSADQPGLDWHRLIAESGLSGLERQAAARSQCVKIAETGVVLRNETSSLTAEPVRRALERAFSRVLGHPFSVAFEKGEAEGDTVWQQENRAKIAEHEARVAAFARDPLVKEAVGRFGGTILEDTVRALEKAPADGKNSRKKERK